MGNSLNILETAKKHSLEQSQNLSRLSRTAARPEIKPGIKTGESIPQFYFPQGKSLDSVSEATIRVKNGQTQGQINTIFGARNDV